MTKCIRKLLYRGSCIRTNSGLYFDIENPTIEMCNINDVAHSLCNIVRFGGHTQYPYTVGTHSILCCMKAQEEGMDGFEALMHDTPEFVLGDVMSPLKRLLHDYQRIEAKVSSVIAGAFKFTYPTPSSVKDIDREILELEFEKYFLGKQKPFQAKPEDFLRLYHQLKPNSYD